MSKLKFLFTLCLGVFFTAKSNAFQDPNNLFLVEVDNVYNVEQAGKPASLPSTGDRALSAEEILMYKVLNCRWEDGRWLRFTSNPNAKGTIKVGHPFLQPGSQRIFFISDIPGGVGGFDIYYAELKNGKWSDPTNIGLKVNTTADEQFPFVTDAGVLQIYRNSTQANYDLNEVLGEAKQLVQAVTKPSTPAATPVVAPTKPVSPAQATISTVSTPKPPVATPTAAPVQAAQNKGLEYRVQLGSFSAPNWTVLNQLQDLGGFKTIKTATGLTSVHLGAFTNLEAAQSLLAKVRSRAGFENAYVVGVENDQVKSVHR